MQATSEPIPDDVLGILAGIDCGAPLDPGDIDAIRRSRTCRGRLCQSRKPRSTGPCYDSRSRLQTLPRAMTLQPVEPCTVIEEMLREKSLLAIWRSSLRIRAPRTNRWIRWGSLAAVSCYAFGLPHDSASLVEAARSMAALWLPTMLSLLGLLLAGLTFFVSSERLAMLKAMAVVQNKDTGISVLKENLFAFVRPLVELLLISVFLFLAMLAAARGSWQVEAVKRDASGLASFYVSRVGFAAVVQAIVLGFVAVKSAIRNVYHIVMTGLRWELEQDQDHKDNGEEIDDLSDPSKK